MECHQRHMTLLNLDLRRAQICAALKDLTDIRVQLQLNASESKNSIQSSFCRQLQLLRTREVHLLSQVDTLVQVKQDQLSLQSEVLNRELGALEALTGQAKSTGSGVAVQDIESVMKRFQQFHLVPEEDAALSFDGDSKNLKKAILTYGSVNSKRPRLARGDDQMNSAAELIGPFEKYADRQVWLQKPQTSSGDAAGNTPPVFLEKGNMDSWLLKTDDDFAMVTADVDASADKRDDSFVVVPVDNAAASNSVAIAAHFTDILNSPNMQWIQDKSKKPLVGEGRHQMEKRHSYYRPSGSIRDWLKKTAPKQPDAQEEHTMEVQVNPSCNPGHTHTKSVEIEDLAELSCVREVPSPAANPCTGTTTSPQRQQRKPDKNTSQQSSCCIMPPVKSSEKKTSGASIEEVCKGNEKCKSFEECLCEDNCEQMARPGKHFDGTPESSKNKWLIRSSQPPPQAEKKSGSESCEKAEMPAKCGEEKPKADSTRDWLVTDTMCDYESSIISGFLKWQLDENPDWLRRSNSVAADPPQQPKSSDPNIVDEWLHKRGKDCDTDNKRSEDGQKQMSTWLLQQSLRTNSPSFQVPKQDATISWLVKDGGERPRESFMPFSKEESMREKWLLKQALGVSVLGLRPTGFPYFNTPMSVNHWLKK